VLIFCFVATSTGTTIVGVKFGGGESGEEEGVCLGADTRATGGPIVADKNCEKVSLKVTFPPFTITVR
jgi:20S proteasome alpha/beta subunit